MMKKLITLAFLLTTIPLAALLPHWHMEKQSYYTHYPTPNYTYKRGVPPIVKRTKKTRPIKVTKKKNAIKKFFLACFCCTD